MNRAIAIRSIATTSLSIGLGMVAPPVRCIAATLPPTANDIVVLASQWWGVSYRDFPSVAGLQAGQYSEGDDPAADILPEHKGYMVICPIESQVGHKWSPPELFPFGIYFSPGEGLIQVTGISNLSQSDLVAKVSSYYGPPDGSASSLGLTGYRWTFDHATLDVKLTFFYMSPRRS